MIEPLGILAGAIGTFLALTMVYFVIRFAVRDGVVDAHRRVGAGRGPNGR